MVGKSDHWLALKRLDLDNDGNEDGVGIVRHAESSSNGNTCELLILQRAGSEWVVKDSSGTIVDCLYNDVARNAQDLSDNLTVKAGEITYVNQGVRSNVTFKLAFDDNQKMWFLSEASSTSSLEDPQTGNMTVAVGTARYPQDIPLTPIGKVDPESLQKVMDKHRKTID
ncbi:hypothetical protein NIBR502774_14210 (plasmid) [Rhizobium sp. NIBRBAC000502774]|nr:hypothetical protein NIBR502774_14210 [Rhizobium sp. NIBRBAC000502774]